MVSAAPAPVEKMLFSIVVLTALPLSEIPVPIGWSIVLLTICW